MCISVVVRIEWHDACQAHQIMPRLIPSTLPMPQTWGRRAVKGNSTYATQVIVHEVAGVTRAHILLAKN